MKGEMRGALVKNAENGGFEGLIPSVGRSVEFRQVPPVSAAAHCVRPPLFVLVAHWVRGLR